jgi:hypothetical protein
MSYRPITDTWILARYKTKFFGAFPGFSLELGRCRRAVAALGAGTRKSFPAPVLGSAMAERSSAGGRGSLGL